MTWDYRLTKLRLGDEVEFGIREVYYGDDGKVTGWTKDPVEVVGDTPEEVSQTLRRMQNSVRLGVIDITPDTGSYPEVSS